ncbi:MAG: hypothetical protein FJ148_10185 [Deltaproteobacteria bacterium]|nr:hypothetical protein [Deltaproteobacteria bacterium]
MCVAGSPPRRNALRSSTAGLLFLHVLLLAALAAASPAADRPPNLVLLIGDDHGWPYSGFMGHPIVRTPNLDALAASGTTFVNAHATASVCQPALRALLAGVHDEQWTRRRRVLEGVFGAMPVRSEVQHYRTVPRELARRGYLSWEGGKLWEGTFVTAGFTHGLATFLFPDPYRSAGDQFGRDGWSDGTAMAPLDAFLDQAGEQPFFLWVAPMLPHVPHDAPGEFTAPYQNAGLPPEVAAYYANVSWLDAVVGAVLATLERRGLRDDTLVVYLSDNGKDAALPSLSTGTGTGKGTLHELGFRTPLVLSWPGHIGAGVVRDDLVSTLDVPATLLDYAGAAPIGDRDGMSLRDALEQGEPVGRSKLVGRYRGRLPENDGWYVRTPQWRYLVTSGGVEKLYAIASDPFETRDVASTHPELRQGFREDVRAWQSRLDAGSTTLEVTGRLTDAAGAPVAGEPLEFSGRSAAGRPIRLRALTGTRGDFAFAALPQGSYALLSRRPTGEVHLGARERRIPVPLPAGSIDAHLELEGRPPSSHRDAGTGTIAGLVRGPDRAPLPGATVKLRGQDDARGVWIVARTGDDGRYRAENLPAGTYHVTADAPQVRVTVRTRLRPAETRDVDLVARRRSARADVRADFRG